MNRNILKTLVELEFSRYESWLPRLDRKGLLTSVSAILILLLAMLYLFRDQHEPTFLFTGGAFAMIVLGIYSAAFEVLSFTIRLDRDWWLTFPHSRTVLIYAKFIALMKFVGRMGVYAAISFLLLYLVMIQMGTIEALGLAKLVSTLGATIILAAAATPVAIGFGLMLSLMYKGWAKRLLFFPYLIVLGAGPLVMFFIMTDTGSLNISWFNPGQLLVYTAVIVIVGFPLTYMILKSVGRRGLQYAAEVGRYVASNDPKSKKEVRLRKRESYGKGFIALFRLELSRYTYYEAKPIIKIVMFTILAGVMIATFFIFPNINGLVMFPMVVIILLLIMVIASSLNLNTFESAKGALIWWLSYPYDRRILSLSRTVALWLTSLKYMLMIWAAYWIGLIASWLFKSTELSIVITAFQWFIFTTVLFGSAFIIILGVLQIGYYFMKSIFLALLMAPLYFGAIYAPVMMMQVFYPDDLYNVSPEWTLLGITLLIGMLLAGVGMWFGPKYLYLLVDQQAPASKNN